MITRTLRALTSDSSPGEFEIVVVCNGCSDDTEQVAAAFSHPDVKVLAIVDSSKARAMSRGDEVASAFPRLYLDADVELDTTGARALVSALAGTAAVVASPHYLLHGCTPAAALYWREWMRRNSEPLSGTGCFGLAREARASFGDFPGLLGDDLWVAGTFQPRPVAEAVTHVRVARTLPAVFRRRVRIARGNHSHRTSPVSRPAPGWGPAGTSVAARTHPVGLALLAAVHAGAAAWARIRPEGNWAQDETTRGARG